MVFRRLMSQPLRFMNLREFFVYSIMLLPRMAGPRRAPIIPHRVPTSVFRLNSQNILVMQQKHNLPTNVRSFLSKK